MQFYAPSLGMDEDARNWVFKANSCMQEAMNTAGHIKSISDFQGFWESAFSIISKVEKEHLWYSAAAKQKPFCGKSKIYLSQKVTLNPMDLI